MPQALQLPLLCLGTSKASDDYAACVRESIRLGGCSASRSLFVGAVSAALGCNRAGAADPLGIPTDWLAQLAEPDRMKALAEQLAARCAGP